MDAKERLKKIRELDELRALLVEEVQQVDQIELLEKAQPMIKPGSKEHETLLSTGYQMDKAKAELILKEREERPDLWPYAMKEKAEAFLAALDAKPTVISKRHPWRIRQHSRHTTTSVR